MEEETTGSSETTDAASVKEMDCRLNIILDLFRFSPSPSEQAAQWWSDALKDEIHNKAEEDGDGWNDEVEQKQRTHIDGKVQCSEEHLADVVHDKGVEGEDEETAPRKHCTGSCLARLNQICGDTDDGDDAEQYPGLVDEDVVFPTLRQGIGNGQGQIDECDGP